MDNTDTEDEDYVPDANEMASFDDHIDNLFADHDAEEQKKGKKRKDNKPWEVEVIEDGFIRPLKQTVFEAASIPSRRKILLRFNESNQAVSDGGKLLSGYLGSLGADFKTFPISMKSWHEIKEYKESRTFYFEDPKGKIKKDILKRLEKLLKDARSNLFHTFYDDTKSIDENVKKYKPRGVDLEHWRFFLKYRLSEDTQNDSLAQVLGKEHPERVRGMGTGLCPTQINNHGTQHTGFASHVNVEEYKREIVELKAEAGEEKKKRQSMEHIVRYLLQQQGDDLPPNIAAEMNSLGSGPSSTDIRDL
ncbi:hypothetical protein PIB30_041416 [Stylosanthes scabra]|uniref:Uncharacterized protein n=1 Tax=Stylosanthes scabra TaxID=79078 RepID=A0ABU6UE65_9FABA|nr:hypothetical protein [Stylosanthes scabra]